MILGVIFILSGILIAVYPPLLSIIVAGVLIFLGSTFIYMSYYYRKVSRKFNDPFFDFMFRL